MTGVNKRQTIQVKSFLHRYIPKKKTGYDNQSIYDVLYAFISIYDTCSLRTLHLEYLGCPRYNAMDIPPHKETDV